MSRSIASVGSCATGLICCALWMLPVAPTPASAQNLLVNPESVVYDAPRDRYLVSNWGDGAIVQIDAGGTQTYFSTELMNQFGLAGLYILGDTLLVAAGNAPGAGIVGFDLQTAARLFDIPLPGVGLPNDIVSVPDGDIFVTDYWGSKLYRIRELIPSLYWTQGLPYPNGMTYDALEHRLLILSVTGPGAPIMAVSLEDSSLSTVLATGFSGTDGIVLDSDRRVYVSDWGTDAIHRYDSSLSGPSELFSSGHSDPADIYYDAAHSLIAVPSFGTHTVEFVPVASVAVRSGGGIRPPRVELLQNRPNPFNPATTIDYDLPAETHVLLTIHGPAGRLVRTLVDDRQGSGRQSVPWDGRDALGASVSSGIYFVRLAAGDRASTRKITMAR